MLRGIVPVMLLPLTSLQHQRVGLLNNQRATLLRFNLRNQNTMGQESQTWISKAHHLQVPQASQLAHIRGQCSSQ